jgi:hypothetical protein
MLKHIFLTLLMLIIISCRDQNVRFTARLAPQDTPLIQEDFRPTTVSLSFEDISISYIPTGMFHEIQGDKVLFFSLEGDLVAKAQAVTLTNRPGLLGSDDQPLLIKRQVLSNQEIELQFFDINYFSRFSKISFFDGLEHTVKSFDGNSIKIEKPESTYGLEHIISYVFEAPVQNLTSNILQIGPRRRGTFEHWFNNELKMVKTRSLESLRQLEFQVIDSIDLTLADTSSFQVEAYLVQQNDQYDIFNFIITNDIDDGAFVTTSPVHALGYICQEFKDHDLIFSKRLDNGIHYQVSIRSGYLPNCFQREQLDGRIYVFDSKLNHLTIEF